jgi:bla regulator protein blaR1
LLNIPVATLIARGYPDNMPIPVTQLTGLPGWAGVAGERYDIIAKSSLSRPATPDERQAMMRALLADRFKLVTHVENREQLTYDLVFARADHRLGPSIKPSEAGCEARLTAERAAMEAARAEGKLPPPRPMPDRDGNTPPCWGWMMGMPAEGDITLENLATSLRLATVRPVTNKTGLTGSYRIKLTFDFGAALRGPEVAPNPDAPPTVFVALQEQLGLKLEPVNIMKQTLVIDHIERPTEN